LIKLKADSLERDLYGYRKENGEEVGEEKKKNMEKQG